MTYSSTEDSPPSSSTLKQGILIALYIGISASLIRFNKFLMAPGHFPYASVLTVIHMITTFCILALLYLVRPSFFPAMAVSDNARTLEIAKWMLPVGFCFAVSLFASNQAYLYCSVSFLQFMKEANLVIVYVLACLFALQIFTRIRVFVVAWVFIGSCMAVHGEMHFARLGFMLQVVSQLTECLRNVMGETIMSNAGGLRLDPLSYTMFIAPACLVTLVFHTMATWDEEIPVALHQWWPYLVPNALLAVALNLVITCTIKECSAVGFMMAGIIKDLSLVVASCVYFGETVTLMQVVGFVIAVSGVFFWSLMRVCPDAWPVQGLADALGSSKPCASALESIPISAKPQKSNAATV